MPQKKASETIHCTYFTWRLRLSRHGVYFADGRAGNDLNLGRPSLNTKDHDEALARLRQLDAVKAVEHGLVDRSILNGGNEDLLDLEDGVRHYLEHVGRPAVTGGACAKTQQRYRAVFDKFLAFARQQGVASWNHVKKPLLERYSCWLEDRKYTYATQYLELTTLKQAINWLAHEDQGYLPKDRKIKLWLAKPSEATTTYCYRDEEVAAMIEHCSRNDDLVWLGQVIKVLSSTGVRIGELVQLCWEDVLLDEAKIQILDTTRSGKRQGGRQMSTKTHASRIIPIHDDLLTMLQGMSRHPDGFVFHGPRGGRLKPDTVRNALKRDVLNPLSKRFPRHADGRGLIDGRLHSFRHYFCSHCASNGVPELTVRKWLGHRDSNMIRRYYQLHDEEARRQMNRLNFGKAGGDATQDSEHETT
jgi:integrase